MNVQWYVSKDGETFGPMSPQSVSNDVVSGRFSGIDLVWRGDDQSWVNLADALRLLSLPSEGLSRRSSSERSLWRSIFGHFTHETLRLFQLAFQILFRPTRFARERLHLSDHSNFIRGLKLYLLALSYSILIMTSARLISRLPLFENEVRLWAWFTLIFFVYTLVYWISSRLVVTGGIRLQDIVHIELYVLSAAAVAGSLYFASVTLVEYALEGTKTSADFAADPVYQGIYRCLNESSAFYRIFFGNLSTSNSPSFAETALRSGLMLYVVYIAAASKIVTVKYSVTLLKAATWITIATAFSLSFFMLSTRQLVVQLIERNNCVVESWYTFGRADTPRMLKRLLVDLNADLPISSQQTTFRKVEAIDREVVQYFDYDLKMDSEREGTFQADARSRLVKEYCVDAPDEPYITSMRRLGIWLREIHTFNNGQTRLSVLAGPKDC